MLLLASKQVVLHQTTVDDEVLQVLQESSSGLRFGSTRGCVQKVRGSSEAGSPRSPKKRASSPVSATKTFSRRKASVRPATAMGFRHELDETPLEFQFQPLGRTHSTLETHTVFTEKKEDDEVTNSCMLRTVLSLLLPIAVAGIFGSCPQLEPRQKGESNNDASCDGMAGDTLDIAIVAQTNECFRNI